MKTTRKKKTSTASAPAPTPAAEEPKPTLFEVQAAGAREVYLAGTFNDWHPTTLPMVDLGQGKWSKEVVLAPGTYEYLFVADGCWFPDPEATLSAPNPYGGSNSVKIVR